MKKITVILFIALCNVCLHACLYGSTQTQALVYQTSGELSQGKSSSFAGGSACCGCKIDHYGTLPESFPAGKASSVTFYLRGSRSDSYYNRIKTGPTTLRLLIGGRSAVATSHKVTDNAGLPEKVSWLLTFQFTPSVELKPNMEWKLLDGDKNKYSAVLLHSSDVDLAHGIPGFYKTYGCKYARVEDQRYSVRFDMAELLSPIPADLAGEVIVEKVVRREKIFKTAVVEFSERGDLGIQDAGTIVAEWMTTSLSKTGAFEVYERLSLEKLMKEHKMGMTGLIDEETIARIGKMRGVEAIITGSVIKFGDVISVTAKLINTETAKIIDSADFKVNDVNAISSRMDGLAAALATDLE